MKKRYFINILPINIWLFGFICFYVAHFFQYGNFALFDKLFLISSYVVLALYVLLPTVFVIINGALTKSYNEYFISNTILSFSCAIGYLVYGLLYYFFISSDGATLAVATVFTIVEFAFVFTLTLIGFTIKFLIKRLQKNALK